MRDLDALELSEWLKGDGRRSFIFTSVDRVRDDGVILQPRCVMATAMDETGKAFQAYGMTMAGAAEQLALRIRARRAAI